MKIFRNEWSCQSISGLSALTHIKYVYENILYVIINIFVDWIESVYTTEIAFYSYNSNGGEAMANGSIFPTRNRIMCINFAIFSYLFGQFRFYWIFGNSCSDEHYIYIRLTQSLAKL